MAETSIDLRRRLVEAYRSKKSGTYAATAALFGVGEATVSRLLRRHRETGDVQHKPRGGNRKREIDLEWLREHLAVNPDGRLIDRRFFRCFLADRCSRAVNGRAPPSLSPLHVGPSVLINIECD